MKPDDGQHDAGAPPDETAPGASVAGAAEPGANVADGLRFVHLMMTQQQAAVAELSASFYALLETLIAEGRVATRDYEARRHLAILRENERTAAEARVHVSPVVDKYTFEGLVEIDCEARLPLCKGRCCMLPMVLGVQDLDEQKIRWDYARPYVVAQGEDGRCVHQAGERCSVYAERPASCRAYDCRDDPRIWQDFERRIPAAGSPR